MGFTTWIHLHLLRSVYDSDLFLKLHKEFEGFRFGVNLELINLGEVLEST